MDVGSHGGSLETEAQLEDRTARKTLAYHEMMTILGIGDLHPGGTSATNFLLTELGKLNPTTVLEVGAGSGLTTLRMMQRGWHVTPIEPNSILCEKLSRRCRVPPYQGSFESFDERGQTYDAILGEGVFYRLELVSSAAKLHRLLRPGGLLALLDMLWTEEAKSDVASFIHDQTNAVFGIPMVPRQTVTASRWKATLRDIGFSEVATRKIDGAALDTDRHVRRGRLLSGLLKHPGLLPLFLRYRLYCRVRWAPPGWLESSMTVWKRT
jgi:SAM-dependent methyltransferase